MDNLTVQTLNYPFPDNVQVDVLRLDMIHPIISGNKWFKLKGHLRQALTSPGRPILTFGGAWSNHLVATAFAARELGLPAIGVIRGQRPPQLSSTLEDAIAYGMQVIFVTREEYDRKEHPDLLQQLNQQYPGVYIIPEGGGGKAGVLGSEDILHSIDTIRYTHILCAIGTGTTFLGIARAAAPNINSIGVPVLKGFNDLDTIDPDSILTPEQRSHCHLLPNYHFGGYARHPQPLLDFMNLFYRQTGIPSDIVYTGKLFYALCDSVERHFFPAHSRLLVIHSGGLQGNRSLSPGRLEF